mgnify:CR=1 FL=1
MLELYKKCNNTLISFLYKRFFFYRAPYQSLNGRQQVSHFDHLEEFIQQSLLECYISCSFSCKKLLFQRFSVCLNTSGTLQLSMFDNLQLFIRSSE